MTPAKKRALIAVIAFILVLVALIPNCMGFGDDWYDRNAHEGPYKGKSEEQIIADLNALVEEGMMNISIRTIIEFPEGSTKPGTANIENIAANHVDQKVTITLTSGEIVYQSGAVAPGHSIDTIELNRDLSAGTHDAVATFVGYDTETHEETGQLSAEVKLVVG